MYKEETYMNKENNDYKKWECKQLSPGLWVIQLNDVGESKDENQMRMIESVFKDIEGIEGEVLKDIEDELNEYRIDRLSHGIWIIQLDENNQLIMKIKNKLKKIFQD